MVPIGLVAGALLVVTFLLRSSPSLSAEDVAETVVDSGIGLGDIAHSDPWPEVTQEATGRKSVVSFYRGDALLSIEVWESAQSADESAAAEADALVEQGLVMVGVECDEIRIKAVVDPDERMQSGLPWYEVLEPRVAEVRDIVEEKYGGCPNTTPEN